MNKPAIQSSTFQVTSEARYAFDGNMDQNMNLGGSCSHTTNQDTKPLLQVDLERKALIRKVVIYNRVDCCSDRFQNANVTVADTSDRLQNQILCIHIAAITRPNNIQTFACADDIIGRFVRITNDHNYLNLCEVEVIGIFFTYVNVTFINCLNWRYVTDKVVVKYLIDILD